MRRNGFRVVHKELKTFYDGTRKANLDVEIAVDMLSLAGRYDTAVLVSGDEDFVYAVNAVAYKGCRVEVAGFRSNTAPKLIDVADYFIDLGEIADKVRKEAAHAGRYYDHHPHHDEQPQTYIHNGHDNSNSHALPAHNDGHNAHAPAHIQPNVMAHSDNHIHQQVFDDAAARAIDETEINEELEQLSGFIRVTDDQ
jgi:hypothetical protein